MPVIVCYTTFIALFANTNECYFLVHASWLTALSPVICGVTEKPLLALAFLAVAGNAWMVFVVHFHKSTNGGFLCIFFFFLISLSLTACHPHHIASSTKYFYKYSYFIRLGRFYYLQLCETCIFCRGEGAESTCYDGFARNSKKRIDSAPLNPIKSIPKLPIYSWEVKIIYFLW